MNRPLSSKMKKSFVVSLPALILSTAISGCGSTTNQSTQTSTSNESQTQVANTQTALTFLGGAGEKALYDSLATAFHQKYPKITINVQTEADNDYNTVLPRDLASNKSPDLFGPTVITQEVKDNLVANLDSYAKQYDWASKVPTSVLNVGRVNSNAVEGSGSLYEAGGNAGSVVGVYYDKALAAKIGMTSPPTNLTDFESLLAKAKAAGLTPIEIANEDGTGNHLFNLLLGDYAGATAVNNIVYNAPGAKVNSAEALKAGTVLQNWIKSGYFNADSNAVVQQTSYGNFAGGTGVFMFQGSWAVPVIDQAFKGKYGFFPMPPVKGGKYTAMTGNLLSFSISAKSQHKDAAALFLNWLTTPAAEQVARDNGFYTPGTTSTSTPAPLSATLDQQLQDGYSLVSANNGFDSWIVNANSSMMPTMTAQLQLLFAGKTTPDQMLQTLQSTYTAG